MAVKTKDTSSNPTNGRQYDRTAYHCETDDSWIVVELPKKA